MAAAPRMTNLVPTADELLALGIPSLGEVFLKHLESFKTMPDLRICFQEMLSESNFFNVLEQHPPFREYGAKQPAVNEALKKAWQWLVEERFVVRNSSQQGPWFNITYEGEELLAKKSDYEWWEEFGLDRVKSDLQMANGNRCVGSHLNSAWKWVAMKEEELKGAGRLQPSSSSGLTWIADTRLEELRSLSSSNFDLQKLIRLCQELNIAAREGCYFAIGMLTRGLLDHVPPIFGVDSFSKVANNYVGGSKSFKDTMLHLDTAAKKIADGLLHTQIRKSEMLPTAQQVNFAPALDLLLGEIIRITK